MLVITQRVLNGHEITGYTLKNETGMICNMGVMAVKQRAKAGLIQNVNLVGDCLTGINGFQLKELPSIQLKDINKQLKNKECYATNKTSLNSIESKSIEIGLVLSKVWFIGDKDNIYFGDKLGDTGLQSKLGLMKASLIGILHSDCYRVFEQYGRVLAAEFFNKTIKPITIGNNIVSPGDSIVITVDKLLMLKDCQCQGFNITFQAVLGNILELVEQPNNIELIQCGTRGNISGKHATWQLLDSYINFKQQLNYIIKQNEICAFSLDYERRINWDEYFGNSHLTPKLTAIREVYLRKNYNKPEKIGIILTNNTNSTIKIYNIQVNPGDEVFIADFDSVVAANPLELALKTNNTYVKYNKNNEPFIRAVMKPDKNEADLKEIQAELIENRAGFEKSGKVARHGILFKNVEDMNK